MSAFDPDASRRISPSLPRLCLGLLTLFALSGCEEEEEPPPPSDPPVIAEPMIECGEVTDAQRAATYEEYDLAVVREVSVMISDPQRDLLDDSVRGELNGLPLETLTDQDADLRYVWTAPVEGAPIACAEEMVVRVVAEDLDGNRAELVEILKK